MLDLTCKWPPCAFYEEKMNARRHTLVYSDVQREADSAGEAHV